MLEDRQRGLDDASSRVDVQDEDYEFVPGEQESSGGVGRSDRVVSSTLSSKAGIILVSLPLLVFFSLSD